MKPSARENPQMKTKDKKLKTKKQDRLGYLYLYYKRKFQENNLDRQVFNYKLISFESFFKMASMYHILVRPAK